MRNKEINYPFEFGRATVIITDFIRYSNKKAPDWMVKLALDWAKENCQPYQLAQIQKDLNISLGIDTVEVKPNV